MFSLLRSISLVKGRLVAMVLLSSLATSSLASNLTDIQFAELPGQRFEIKLKFDEQPSTPKGYTIEKPARVVLDFPGVESLLNKKKFPVSFDAANSVVVLSSGGRTRMIVNLNELVSYNTRVDGSDFVVEMGSGGASSFIKSGSNMAAEISNSRDSGQYERSITSLDFRRGEDGEGKIILGLSDPNVNIDANSSGGKLSLNFDGVSIPADLRRRLDVIDFATPVSFVDTSYDGGSTKVVIETSREYDYLAYQADDQYVVSIKPLTQVEREERKKQFEFVGKKLSLNFQNIEVRSVLQLIADITDLNLVASDTVGGSITLRLENVPWDQALSLVLKTKGLDKRQVGNVLMVAPAAEIAERERLELETQKQLEELAPLRTEYIRVRYANARELFKLFNQPDNGGVGSNASQDGNSTGSILSERGQAIVDERTNSIILTDTEEKIQEFRKLIAQVDIPVRQVMIEARIVVANTDYRKELGVRWQAVGRHQIRSTTQRVPVLDSNGNATFDGNGQQIFRTQTVNQRSGLFSGSTEAFSADNFDSNGVWTPTIDQANMVDLGVANPFGSIAMWLSTDNGSLGLELSALEDSGFAEIVSQPKVVTGDKQIAFIESGQEIGYQEASASGATSTSFRQAVLKLEVTPQITPDDRIIMDLLVKQDDINGFIAGVPVIDVNRIDTEVLVDNGQTIVLGGIFQDQVTKGTSKVPLLGDIPYLGRLFKKDLQVREKRELLIFITPKILAQSLTE
ncbi:type IV pilus secretin PilQ [Pseudoteredinibacter isoporae]|uniref:Type IV pilus assembly protein PilQ n=1 Tax=Pseudoteredinibacter isoporae TaxID=570281 RepID=A0A7X0MVG3_9GAMM|nr:type IV pilus secretin PilQ [Pseudoteredinibacter isoporae]MBB6519799.1 type IV pilus assembly protein PilQ [Pseudoteredinibacter isoporae]